MFVVVTENNKDVLRIYTKTENMRELAVLFQSVHLYRLKLVCRQSAIDIRTHTHIYLHMSHTKTVGYDDDRAFAVDRK